MFTTLKQKIADTLVKLFVAGAMQNNIDVTSGKSASDKYNALRMLVQSLINRVGTFVHTNDSVNIDFATCSASEFINALPNRSLILLNYGNIDNSTFPTKYGTIFGVKLSSGWEYSIFFVSSGSALYLGVYHANEYPSIKWTAIFDRKSVSISSSKLDLSNLRVERSANTLVIAGYATVTNREIGVTTLFTASGLPDMYHAKFVIGKQSGDTFTTYGARFTRNGDATGGCFLDTPQVSIDAGDVLYINGTILLK